jgi:uncharacterized protein involved in exopolysaccharide biosynthesis
MNLQPAPHPESMALLPREDALLRTRRDLLAVGFRHRRLMLISFIAIFLGVLLANFWMSNQYESRMKILVKGERVDPVVTPEPTAQRSFNMALGVTVEDLNSEVELLKGRDLLEKVVLACGLDKPGTESFWGRLASHWPSAPNPSNAQPDTRVPLAVRQLENKLKVETILKTNLINATYKSNDPALAARVLNTLADLYLEKHLAVHRPPGALDFFQQQEEQYRKGLTAAEERLAGFDRDEGVISAPLEKEITLRKLTDFDALFSETQAAIAATKQRIHSLEAQTATTPSRQTTQVSTKDNPFLMQQMKSTLLNLELKRTELLTKFEPTYRPVQEVETQIAQAHAAIVEAEKNPTREETTDLDSTHEWLKEELAKARAELATLEARSTEISRITGEYRSRAETLGRKEIAQHDLIRSTTTAEENYLLYVRKTEEARISDALDRKRILNVSIAEAATVPALPSGLGWGLALLLGGVLAGFSSVGFAFMADYMDPSFRTPQELEEYLGIVVLASTPRHLLPAPKGR